MLICDDGKHDPQVGLCPECPLQNYELILNFHVLAAPFSLAAVVFFLSLISYRFFCCNFAN